MRVGGVLEHRWRNGCAPRHKSALAVVGMEAGGSPMDTGAFNRTTHMLRTLSLRGLQDARLGGIY